MAWHFRQGTSPTRIQSFWESSSNSLCLNGYRSSSTSHFYTAIPQQIQKMGWPGVLNRPPGIPPSSVLASLLQFNILRRIGKHIPPSELLCGTKTSPFQPLLFKKKPQIFR
jgi:hypothetical protein